MSAVIVVASAQGAAGAGLDEWVWQVGHGTAPGAPVLVVGPGSGVELRALVSRLQHAGVCVTFLSSGDGAAGAAPWTRLDEVLETSLGVRRPMVIVEDAEALLDGWTRPVHGYVSGGCPSASHLCQVMRRGSAVGVTFLVGVATASGLGRILGEGVSRGPGQAASAVQGRFLSGWDRGAAAASGSGALQMSEAGAPRPDRWLVVGAHAGL